MKVFWISKVGLKLFHTNSQSLTPFHVKMSYFYTSWKCPLAKDHNSPTNDHKSPQTTTNELFIYLKHIYFLNYNSNYFFFLWIYATHYTLIYLIFNKSLSSLSLQALAKYLRLTLVFMQNSALREKFNFCFWRDFC